jgi:hypothetical protein
VRRWRYSRNAQARSSCSPPVAEARAYAEGGHRLGRVALLSFVQGSSQKRLDPEPCVQAPTAL